MPEADICIWPTKFGAKTYVLNTWRLQFEYVKDVDHFEGETRRYNFDGLNRE